MLDRALTVTFVENDDFLILKQLNARRGKQVFLNLSLLSLFLCPDTFLSLLVAFEDLFLQIGLKISAMSLRLGLHCFSCLRFLTTRMLLQMLSCWLSLRALAGYLEFARLNLSFAIITNTNIDIHAALCDFLLSLWRVTTLSILLLFLSDKFFRNAS